jgi:beta-N-acetylhexosaminidase
LAAGCDLVLHCSGERSEMEAVAQSTPPISPESAARIARAESNRRTAADQAPSFEPNAARAELDGLLAAS